MGRLILPPASRAYVDTSPIIYTIEGHEDHAPTLEPFWDAARSREIEVVTSELTVLETLVLPIRKEAQQLIETYELIFAGSEVSLHPVTIDVLREAARFRATQNLKTPDAIHAATAMLSGCTHLITNDPSFRRLDAIEVIVMSDHL